MFPLSTARPATPATEAAVALAKPKRETTSAPAVQRATSWPVLTAIADPLNDLLQRSASGRAIPDRASAGPELDANAALSAAPDAAREEGPIGSTGLDTEHRPVGMGSATADRLSGLLQRSVSGRAIAAPADRATSLLPGLQAAHTDDEEGPIGNGRASALPATPACAHGCGCASCATIARATPALPATSDAAPACGHDCGCASCSADARATDGARMLARQETAVAGPCKDVEVRPHPALLKKGSQQPAVREAQRKLNLAKSGDVGTPLNPDCIFGPKTDAAVREFQQAQFDDPKAVDGKIGPKTWAKLDLLSAGPVPPIPPIPPTPPTPVTITSATVKAAPSGAANTRKEVGVGEVVDFTASAAGTWKASHGEPTAGAPSTTFRWTAPATAVNVTITLTSGTQTVADAIKVVAPTSISMRKLSSHTSLVGVGGACMRNEVKFGPNNVCLGATQWFEVPGPPSGITTPGFFDKFSAATLHHNPTTFYIPMNDSNILEGSDHCAWHTTPGPYTDGSFTWVIPNRYKLDGEPDSKGRFFTNTNQVFTMNAAGTMSITKAGAST